MKERVTLTIDDDLLRQVDSTVDKESVKNRSHAVELLLRRVLRGKVPRTAVVLAGGTTQDGTPRCLREIKGVPVLQHNLDLLRRHGVTDIILAVGKGSDLRGRFDKSGLKVSYVEEDEPLGTAGCLRILKDRLTEPFLMLNGDELKDIDLERLYDAHNRYEGTVTIALTAVRDPAGYGVAVLDGHRILRFEEKPHDAESTLINAGLYVMEPLVTGMVPEGRAMLEEDLFPILAREGRLFGYVFSGQWFGLNSSEEVAKAERRWER